MCHVSLGVNGLGTASTPTPVDFEFSTVAKGKVRLTSSKNPISDAQPSSATFLPVREMLTLAKGFIGMYAERDLGFDETYRDIAIQLDVPELLGPKQAGTKDMLAAYESVLEANTVFRQDGRFFFRLGGGNIEADLVAEGYRKLGNVIYLIKNGMLNPESVLFWDEPEANLNPRLVRPTAEFLLQLVRLGAQVFITTHDYLLVRTLGVMADNREAYSLGPDMVRFINLHTTSEKGTEVECAHSLFALQCNAILEEIEAHYRWEENLVLGQFTPS
jgi:hypothetical protein